MPDPMIRLGGEWRPSELRLYWADSGPIAEYTFSNGDQRQCISFGNPSPLSALMEIFPGIDSLEVFDRNTEGFYLDFGRYRAVYFIDDHFEFDADFVSIRRS